MSKITQTQARALAAIAKAPLFRGSRGVWSRPGASPVTSTTVEALLAAGLVAREHARNGTPYVRITHVGRKHLGQPTAAEQIARHFTDLHARIAP